MKYHAMTIDYYNGKTYWNKSKDKLKDVDYAVATDKAKKLAETVFSKLKS